jgi:hypothetical protein
MKVYGLLREIQKLPQMRQRHGYFQIQEQLKKVRRFIHYPNAMVIAEFPDYCQ